MGCRGLGSEGQPALPSGPNPHGPLMASLPARLSPACSLPPTPHRAQPRCWTPPLACSAYTCPSSSLSSRREGCCWSTVASSCRPSRDTTTSATALPVFLSMMGLTANQGKEVRVAVGVGAIVGVGRASGARQWGSAPRVDGGPACRPPRGRENSCPEIAVHGCEAGSSRRLPTRGSAWADPQGRPLHAAASAGCRICACLAAAPRPRQRGLQRRLAAAPPARSEAAPGGHGCGRVGREEACWVLAKTSHEQQECRHGAAH